MKNRIEIEFNRGIYKAFWLNENRSNKTTWWKIQHRSELIFVANTKDQVEQRAKEFIESHPGIEGYTLTKPPLFNLT